MRAMARKTGKRTRQARVKTRPFHIRFQIEKKNESPLTKVATKSPGKDNVFVCFKTQNIQRDWIDFFFSFFIEYLSWIHADQEKGNEIN